MDRSTVDYSRVMQPQQDGYDVAAFLALKQAEGFAKQDVPGMFRVFDHQVVAGRWRPRQFEHEVPCETAAHYALLELAVRRAAPAMHTSISGLLDVLTGVELHDNTEVSTLCPTARYPGAWIVLTSICADPAVALRGIIHEMMHQKLITLGLGSHRSFLDGGEAFILNDKVQLHRSIVNSYADTMQPYMPGPIGRPMLACIHGYASFLSAAAATLQLVPHDAGRAASYMRYVGKWSERLDDCWNAIRDGAQTTEQGAQLLQGLENWTTEHLRDYRAALRVYGDGAEVRAA